MPVAARERKWWSVAARRGWRWTGEPSQVGPYDGFVYAYGGVRVETLSAPLQAAGLEVRVVGDAFSPRSLQHAILEGHQYARDL